MVDNSWEVTTDDVANVLRAHDIEKTDEELGEILDSLDQDEICKAALRGNEIDEQANYAGDVIEDQLIAKGVLLDKKW